MRKPTLKSMKEYLKGHFRYGSRSNDTAYAVNIKLNRLLPYDARHYEALGNQSLMRQVFDTLVNFSDEHRYFGCFPAGQSGGYLVLYARRQHYTGHKSYCRCCGQRNFRPSIEMAAIPLHAGHQAWPMVHEMIKLTGMSAGNPQYGPDYFAMWARNFGRSSFSYFELFTLAEKLAPLIVGKGSVIKCGKCGSPDMVNFKESPFHWEAAGSINDSEEEIDELEKEQLIERYNLIRAFDKAAQDLIAEFKYQAENWDAEENELVHPSDDEMQEVLAV